MQICVQALEKAVNADMKQVSEYFGELHEAGDPSKMLRVIGNFLRVFDSTLDEIQVSGKTLRDMCTSAPNHCITGFVAVNQWSPQCSHVCWSDHQLYVHSPYSQCWHAYGATYCLTSNSALSCNFTKPRFWITALIVLLRCFSQ